MYAKQLMIQLFFLLGLLCVAQGCGGGSSSSSISPSLSTGDSDSNDNQTGNDQNVVIEDISCEVSYPVDISKIILVTNDLDIHQLYDKDKTNNSIWRDTSVNGKLLLELASPVKLQHLVITWQHLNVKHFYKVSVSKNGQDWQLLASPEESTIDQYFPSPIDFSEFEANVATAKFIELELLGNESSQPSAIHEIEVFGCEANIAHNIELLDWYLSVPTDTDNNDKSDSIKEVDLAGGYTDPRFFTLTQDQGLKFSTSVNGFKTSSNTKYVRSELREMLRRGNTSHSTQGVNKNNWVFATAPASDLANAGGIDGRLKARLKINRVTSTGEDYQIGRVIIGQIHANDDEPVRLYYRKLPNNTKGSIYIAHELLGGDDTYYELLGSRNNNASNPSDGIALDEIFDYTITVSGNELTVTVTKADGSNHHVTIDMNHSGYDTGGQYMYFKAGVYNQNNSGDPHDYVSATFYSLDNSHDGYAHSTQ